jgi:type II secretory pathway pseudopilin PulG
MLTKKAVTLIEILLVVTLSALLMTVIIPFIRSVNDTWNVGSSRTEILQNGRAALETMTRYIREARRITKIPGTSGNYIKIRDRDDKFDIIFYHNVSGSPYYIGNSGIIKVNDLVMRTDVDSLLASSLPPPQSSIFYFFQDGGAAAAKAIDVKSVQIPKMVLSDPLSSITYTLALEDTVTWRQDRLLIWAINRGTSSTLTDIAYGATLGGFNISNVVSNCLSVNPTDGSCWVADRGNSSIKKVSSTGAVLWTVTGGFSLPRAVSINNNPDWSVGGRETVWVADTGNDRIRRVVWTAGAWTYAPASGGLDWAGFTNPSSVSVNSDWSVNGRETVWVADTGAKRVCRIYWSTGIGWTYESIAWTGKGTAYNQPYSVSVNPNERYFNKETCWVAYTVGNSVRKIYATSSTAWTYVTSPVVFSGPRSVSVNPNTGECWVADTGNDRIVKLSSLGSLLWSSAANLFLTSYSVSVNPADDTCWVADYDRNSVVRLAADGKVEWSVGGFSSLMAVSVRP